MQGSSNRKYQDISNRPPGYTRRPVADVRARYRSGPMHTVTKNNNIQDITKKPTSKAQISQQTVKAQTSDIYSNPQKVHHANNKTITLLKPSVVNKPPMVKRHTTVPTKQVVHNYIKREAIPDIPALPTPAHKRFARFRQKITYDFRRKKKTYLISFSAAILLIIGISVNVYTVVVSHDIKQQAKAASAASDTGQYDEQGRPGDNSGLSEDEPDMSTMSKYTVAPDMPRYLSIKNIGVWTRVVRVGVDKNNEIGTPRNVYNVGWYEGSSKPGQPGVAFIDGHVLGPTKGGVFASLKTIKQGAQVYITMGNNTNYVYKVTSTEILETSKVDMSKVLTPKDSTKQYLVLMTCNGTYVKQTETFDKRFIVYAERVN